MIRVTVELISARGPERNRVLGVAEIVNDGSGNSLLGTYRVRLSKFAPKLHETWAEGIVTDFERQRRGPWDLIYQGLRACGIERRNPYVLRVDPDTGELVEEVKK